MTFYARFMSATYTMDLGARAAYLPCALPMHRHLRARCAPMAVASIITDPRYEMEGEGDQGSRRGCRYSVVLIQTESLWIELSAQVYGTP